jgi:ATP-dependent DNA helicase DinG
VTQDGHADALIDQIFSAEGLLGKTLGDFEERSGQKEMARQIFSAYSQQQIALVEAGTGIGKSLAYLVPAVHWALKHQEKTVISTHTISLQQQLIDKDIPFLLKVMDVDLKAVLVKGMGNYLCLRRLQEQQEQHHPLIDGPNRDLDNLEEWSEKAHDGSRSELPFPLAASTWEKVNVEAETCNGAKCPHYKRCFFFKARRSVQDAQILVVNHHLLFADLMGKNSEDNSEKSVLPAYQRLILDEAHHLEEIALECFAKRCDRSALLLLLGRITSEAHPERSRLIQIQKILATYCPILSLVPLLDIQLPAEKRVLSEKIHEAFEELRHFLPHDASEKWRLRPIHFQHPVWEQQIAPKFKEVTDCLRKFAHTLLGLIKEIEAIKTLEVKEKMESHLMELRAVAERLDGHAETLKSFFAAGEETHHVRWIEHSAHQVAIVDADLDISTHLRDMLFEKLATVSLCSATLSTRKEFQFIKEQLGIVKVSKERVVTEKIFDSPFDYKKRTLLVVPTDLPLPTDPGFVKAASHAIASAISASRGNAFVLFTAFDMLSMCFEQVSALLSTSRFHLLKHGQQSRHALLEKFKAQDGSVLFGTDSFWEGVDVAGEALRCVILVKLPFRVPTDPLVEAYTEYLQKMGKNAFMEYAIPLAVRKFKQGFGRLIRKKDDRGCIVCLDKRLITKSYGKYFLESLPNAQTLFDKSETVFDEMHNFYWKNRSNGV